MIPMIIGAAASVLGAAMKDTPSQTISGGPFNMGDYVRIVGSPGASVSTSKIQPYSNPSPYGSSDTPTYTSGGNSQLLLLAVGAAVVFFMMKG